MKHSNNTPPVVILGAGPAGLTAAYELAAHGVRSVVLEQESIPGGLARTVDYQGFLFDIGGHRFYTKVPFIEKIWRDVLGDDLLERPRLSRIYYGSRFYHYPLDAIDVVRGLGVREVLQCGASFIKAHLFPRRPEEDFETWVSNRFGQRLFRTFFRTYTEKVWGIPCTEIRAEWAAQRIRGLTLHALVRDALKPKRNAEGPKTLIREFLYPRRGPGMMWSRMCEILAERGVEVLFDTPVTGIEWSAGRIRRVVAGERSFQPENVISTLPLRNLVSMFSPSAPAPITRAAKSLQYRDFIVVGIIVPRDPKFRDNWIYVHDPEVKVGRIQNYANWSPEMSPDPEMTCLGLEYFCQEGDGLWSMTDEELLALGRRELAHLKLADTSTSQRGMVIRVPKAYPVYDRTYRSHLDTIQPFLQGLSNLEAAGRNGLHRYNNQDHAMLTGILAARNVMGAAYDNWALALDSGYLEEGPALTNEQITALESMQPRVPDLIRAADAS